MSEVVKPTILKVEETRRNLIDVINNANLPPFIIEPIVYRLYEEIKETVTREYEAEKKKYEETLGGD